MMQVSANCQNSANSPKTEMPKGWVRLYIRNFFVALSPKLRALLLLLCDGQFSQNGPKGVIYKECAQQKHNG